MPEEMKKEPVGSVPVNPLMETTTEDATAASPPVTDTGEGNKQQAGEDPRIAQLEKMLNDSKSMIGKQSNEVGALRREIEERKAAEAASVKSYDEELAVIKQQMDDGDIDSTDAIFQVADLAGKRAEENAVKRLNQQQERGNIAKIQQQFLRDNPDYEELRDTGALQPYLDADPLADEYVAFKQYRFDQEKAQIEKDYEAKISAAKEQGAKLAQGAEEAGKVLGKSGSAARAAATSTKPFTNQQEANNAMLAQLRQMRSASTQ